MTTSSPHDRPSTRSAFVAIVGKPNVGKSSILNAILGHKVAIVSDKPQTTRTRIMGVLTRDETQIVFIDTPGMHKPRTRLGDYMVGTVSEAVSGVDACVLVTEPTGAPTPAELELIRRFTAASLPAVLAINKIDLARHKDELLARIAAWSPLYPFRAVVPLSARTGDGIPELLGELTSFAQPGPHFFDDDALTDMPEKVVAAEMIREKLLTLLDQEIPHGIAVTVETFREREEDGLITIDAMIYCERKSHKGIIIGKNGDMLKEVGTRARRDLEAFFGSQVHLTCWVKVREDWRNRGGLLRSFGYDGVK